MGGVEGCEMWEMEGWGGWRDMGVGDEGMEG